MSVFRNRGGSGTDLPGGERPTAIDRCDVAIDDGTNLESRFIVKITFRNGAFQSQEMTPDQGTNPGRMHVDS